MTRVNAITILRKMRLAITASGAEHEIMEEGVEMACDSLGEELLAYDEAFPIKTD